MTLNNRVLFTGGSGLLGSEFKKKFPDFSYPSSSEFDVTNYQMMDAYLSDNNYQTIFHAAAFTSPPEVDKNPNKAIDANIIGTSNIVKLCLKYNLKLIYMSTDYVFRGDQGNYTEDDSVWPINKYAWSKLGGECAVQMYDRALIIRTSFGPNSFPYDKAFTDQWTSRECVSDIVNKIANIINKNITGIVHIGGSRKTVYEYATNLEKNKSIGKLLRREVNFRVPFDTSLNINKYNKLIK